MKKPLLVLFALLINLTVFSQNYQILPSKQIDINYPCNGGFLVHYLKIKNTQEFDTLFVSWKLVSKNIPASLSPQFCDWMNCYAFSTLPSTQVNLFVAPADSQNLMLDLEVANTTETGTFKVEIFDTKNPTNRDTVSYSILACENPLGINDNVRANELAIFPNPCIKELTVRIPLDLSSKINEVSIYNILGTPISSYSIKNQELFKINTSELPAGIYFIKINEGSVNPIIKRFNKTN